MRIRPSTRRADRCMTRLAAEIFGPSQPSEFRPVAAPMRAVALEEVGQ